MVKTIWGYPVLDVLELPKGAEIVAVHLINDVPTIFALVNPKIKKETRYFHVFGSGWEIDLDTYPLKKHLGTIVSHTSAMVWHVYELKKP
jgi:hypothetical protein